MLDKLTEQEQKEYERLQNLEKFGKLAGKPLPKHLEDKLKELRRRLIESIWKGDYEMAGNEKSSSVSESDKEEHRDVFGDIFGIPMELVEYRQSWGMKISNISNESKEKIIKAVDSIPVKVDVDSDGSRLVTFKLGDRTYRILDPKLCNHTDFEYSNHWQDMNKVKLGGMRGDVLGSWKNRKLANYVEEKQKEGLYIPGLEDVLNLLCDLGSIANLDNREDQIAMLMYLTGLDGCYWLAMDEGIRRSRILCDFKARYDCIGVDEHEHNNLLMMSYE